MTTQNNDDVITVSRNGYTATIEMIGGKNAKLTLDRRAPAGPTDWETWIENTLRIRFDTSTKLINAEPMDGEFRFANRGGSRELLKVFDTKPRRLSEGDSV